MLRRTLVIALLVFSGTLFAQNVSNYTFSATAGTFSVIQGSPGSVSPALSAGTWDDGYFNNIPIGFAFIYDGVAYTTLSASTNGWAKFGATAGGSFNGNNLNTGTNRPVLAPLWDDHFLTAGGFTYKTTGTAPNRICTLEWRNVYWSYLAANAGISFQVKLYEVNRRVEFIYRQEAGTISASSASIGINDATSGIFLSLNNTTTTPSASSVTETTTIFAPPLTGQIYRFDHYPLAPVITNVSPVTGYSGNSFTITGSNFDVYSSLTVWCGATKATVLSSTFTQITALAPVGADMQHTTVTNLSSGRTAEANQQYDIQFGCGIHPWVGTFASVVNFSSGSGSRYVEVCDVDGDGKQDVTVTSDGSGGAYIFRNISTVGSFTTASLAAPAWVTSSSGQPGDIQYTDIDGDGKKDLMIADYSTTSLDSISVFRNTSTVGTINAGSFAPRVTFKVPGYPSLSTADIDGDGKPEMLVSSRNASQLIVRRNQSVQGSITTASFGANVTFATPPGAEEVCASDFDGDGKMDVALICNSTPQICVFRNTAVVGTINASSFAPRVDYAALYNCADMQIADLDGDGKEDIIVSYSNYAQMSVFRNTSTTGNITFARYDLNVGSGLSQGVDIGDMDGDGQPDIILKHSSPMIILNLSTPGNLAFDAPGTVYTFSSPFDLAVGDLDGDAKPEVLTTNLSSAQLGVFYNQMSSFNNIAPLTVLNATAFCDNGTWKTYCDAADSSKVLFAVKDNGNNLGTITVNEYRDAAPGNYIGNRFLQRHFKIVPTTQPSSPVQIRLYFTNTELANLQAVDPSVTGAGSLSVTKYNGPTEDGTYNPTDATSLTWYPPGSITNNTAYGGRYLEFTVSGFSEFWIHGGGGVLPIELVSFDAQPVDRTVELNWETASETNNDYFVVERSQDGITTEQVDTVDGAGNSTLSLHYGTVDVHPHEGVSYYRLKQVDFNGHFTYSEWKTVFIEPAVTVAVYPNPTHGELFVQLPGDEDAQWNCTVINTIGQIVFASGGSKAELKHLELNITPGTYFISLVSAGGSSLAEPVNYSQPLIITDQ